MTFAGSRRKRIIQALYTGSMHRHAVAVLASVLVVLGGETAASAQQVTFNKEIAPVIWQNCASCHRPGQIGPFSLVTFEDVRPRAREIVRAVRTHAMPPWKPEPGHGEFESARRLSDSQIALIERWVSQGSRLGNAGDLVPAPSWTAGWSRRAPASPQASRWRTSWS